MRCGSPESDVNRNFPEPSVNSAGTRVPRSTKKSTEKAPHFPGPTLRSYKLYERCTVCRVEVLLLAL